ncbi:hypothetical protein [Streptomyces sp. NRRL S-244]|uniref:hypothetical protein n=1 Tax=Streptomyces sp. NRRL S-244 TaxID=1463897 RepID=UPI0004BF63CE|nr:hypothetical protein [Streptomyces sp. NRRL S-244]
MLDYVGSGPYCYTNSLAMVLGPDAPAPAVIETLTGSPFGMQFIAGALPLFDPYGWHPETGLDSAIGLLGWRCERSDGGTPGEALARLRAACARGPVLVGPVDMGLLLYQPGTPSADGGDHYVVVLTADEERVRLHDPHGHPYATLPTGAFLAAWEAESVSYTDAPYVLRTGFVRERLVDGAEALRRSLPGAVRWLAGRDDLPMPPGSVGGAAAVEELAARLSRGLEPGIRTLLTVFGVRVGARRLGDAAACLAALGLGEAAAIATEQAETVGELQFLLVAGDDAGAAAVLRRLAPTYERLRAALSARTALDASGAVR